MVQSSARLSPKIVELLVPRNLNSFYNQNHTNSDRSDSKKQRDARIGQLLVESQLGRCGAIVHGERQCCGGFQ